MRRAILALIAAWLLIGNAAHSQQLRKPPENPPSHAAQGAQNDNRGTGEPPLAVKIIPSPKTDQEATDEKAEREDKNSADWWMVKLTFGLMIVGIAQFSVFVLQLIIFGLQAKRLKETIEKMDETAIRELRAYVSGEVGKDINSSVVAELTPKTAARVVIVNYNHGRTPAYQVEVNAAIDVLPYPLPPNFILPEYIIVAPPSKTVIHPDGHTGYNARSFAPVTDFQMSQIARGSHKLYVFGKIDYVDAFSVKRETKFCCSIFPSTANISLADAYANHGVCPCHFEYPDQHNSAT